MTMISESGAIADVNEIAAAVGLHEDQVNDILHTALEDLADTLQDFEDVDEESLKELGASLPAFESLRSVSASILESGSISRSDASTLMSVTASLEGFEDIFSGLPLNSFTQLPSKVNFDASMESIFKTVLTKIIEACKKIIASIKAWWDNISLRASQAAVAEVKVEAKLASDIKKIDKTAINKRLDDLKKKYIEKSPLSFNKFFLKTIEEGQLTALMAAFEPYLTSLMIDDNFTSAYARLNEACDKVMSIYGIETRSDKTGVLDLNDPGQLAVHKLLSISEGFRGLGSETVEYSLEDLPALLATIESSVKTFSSRPSMRAFSLWKKVYSKYVDVSRDKLKTVVSLNKEGDVEKADSIYTEVRKSEIVCQQLRQLQSIRSHVYRTKVDAMYLIEKVGRYIDDLSESAA